MIRLFNPLTYMRYLFSSGKQRTAMIFNLLRKEPYCADLLQSLEDYGYEISYPWFGGGGTYHPQELEITGDHFEAEFQELYKSGTLKAHFTLPIRYGLGQSAFYFLHELIHFEQDMDGYLQNRDLVDNEREAAMGAVVLAQKIGGIVWEGALSSLDWGSMAESYGQDIKAGAGHEIAAENIEALWQVSAQKKHYQRQERTHKSSTYSPVHLWQKVYAASA